MRRRLSVLCLLPFFLSVMPCIASAQEQERGEEESATTIAKPSRSEIVVPADTVIPLMLKNAINSRTAFVGQAVYCETIYPITVGNRIVIPVGSYVKGEVTQVVRPGRIKGKAQIGIRFESLTLPNGTTRVMRATLSSYAGVGDEGFNREEGRIEGKTTKGKDAGKIATTATQGTIIGGVTSRSGKGAGIGALSGGVAGLVWVLATRGPHIVLAPGTNFELELSSPVTFYRDEIPGPSPYDEGPALPAKRPLVDY